MVVLVLNLLYVLMVFVTQIIHIVENLLDVPLIKLLLCVLVESVLNLLKIVNNLHINVLFLNTKDVPMVYVEKIVLKFLLMDAIRKTLTIVHQENV